MVPLEQQDSEVKDRPCLNPVVKVTNIIYGVDFDTRENPFLNSTRTYSALTLNATSVAVRSGPSQAWNVLLDIADLAPCSWIRGSEGFHAASPTSFASTGRPRRGGLGS